jgi:hypothetical protein
MGSSAPRGTAIWFRVRPDQKMTARFDRHRIHDDAPFLVVDVPAFPQADAPVRCAGGLFDFNSI